MAFDYAQNVADMQAALRALWPDRKVVYFTATADDESAKGPGALLTHEEQAQLGRVARAIGAARNSEEQVARTTAVIGEGAVHDFLQWLATEHLAIASDLAIGAGVITSPEQPGQLLERWKREREEI